MEGAYRRSHGGPSLLPHSQCLKIGISRCYGIRKLEIRANLCHPRRPLRQKLTSVLRSEHGQIAESTSSDRCTLTQSITFQGYALRCCLSRLIRMALGLPSTALRNQYRSLMSIDLYVWAFRPHTECTD